MPRLADLRFGLRLLARSPLFTITAVLSLAAGIAATATIFSLADAMLFRPRPGVADPKTLVDIGRTVNGEGLDNFGYPLFEAMRAGATQFEGLAAHQFTPQVMSLGTADASERVYAGLVSGNYFAVVGTRPAAGRFFLAEEDNTAGTHPVVVLNHAFWSRKFGKAPTVIGSTIRLNNAPFTIVGVAEEGFSGTMFIGADLWVPMAMDARVRAAERSLRDQHGPVWMVALGRLKPGVAASSARDELQAIMRNYLSERGDPRVERWGVAVEPSARIPAPIATPVEGFVGMLGVLTALVLLIACSNVAGLLLARGLDRRREIATRLAVGASRRRVVGQLLVEGLTLAAIAGAASIPLMYMFVGLLAAWQPALPVPLALDLQVNYRVLGLAFALAGAAAIVFALVPALQSTRVDVAPALRGGHASADRRRAWLRHLLVGGQVAVALLLLVVAGLFVRSLQEAAHADVAFTAAGVDVLQLDTRIGGYMEDAEGIRATEALTERLAALPGVIAVGSSRMVPLQGGGLGLGGLRAAGYAGPDGTDEVPTDWDVVSPGYFDALQLPIVRGRAFGPQDREGAPWVAIVNETMAARVWPGQDPIGKTLIQSAGPDDKRTLQVVGVARASKYRSVGESPRNFIYVPLAQQFMSELKFYVRHRPGPSQLNDLRRAVAAFDPMLPVIHTETLEQATSLGLLPQRIASWIAAGIGSIGLFLAALGLHGLTALSVSQRRREIAIRLAVGAQRQAIVRMVLRQAIVLTVVSAAIGLALAAGLSTLLRGFLIGLGPFDPLAFGAALAVLAAVLLLASWTPAQRAARTDATRALRAE